MRSLLKKSPCGIVVFMSYYPLHHTWRVGVLASVILCVFLQGVVWALLSEKEDMALLISRFQEFLELDDVRYYVMNSARDNIHRVMGRNKRVCMWSCDCPG